MRRFLLALCLTLTTVLSGCTLTPATTARTTPLTTLEMENWQVEGKLAIRYGKTAHSAHFDWYNWGDDYRIRIRGPLGQGNAKLEKQRGKIRLFADGTEQSASSAEELLTMNLGWAFPVSAMKWWVRGLPSPNAAIDAKHENEKHQLTSLQQEGWTIEYKRYQALDHLTLPAKMVASRDNITLTLLLKKWEL
ncbi:lipoprotein insertase outer membrane protein LolB [Teredinibacter purpureus]|uniref:lipoprotein insertase outer membrane protein LolB n=1 Tax=Teredinibacter purpureus TaxID=2731756 RepID=UPI0006975DF9|nr:lipoprotein insertase outer membrane protein LolB [Teredinibacter purpureus]